MGGPTNDTTAHFVSGFVDRWRPITSSFGLLHVRQDETVRTCLDWKCGHDHLTDLPPLVGSPADASAVDDGREWLLELERDGGFPPSSLRDTVSRDAVQNQWIADEVAALAARGAKNIRVDQRQVDFEGNYVGLNRPDLQYNLGRKHYIVELDRPTRAGSEFSHRGLSHYQRILANDPGLPDEQIRLLTIGAPER